MVIYILSYNTYSNTKEQISWCAQLVEEQAVKRGYQPLGFIFYYVLMKDNMHAAYQFVFSYFIKFGYIFAI